MTISWSIDPGEYLERLTRQKIDAIERDIVRLANSLTDEITGFMRSEARWTDQTGAARQALYSDVIHVARESVTILMSHGPAIDYAWYLETVSRGRFSILPDTADRFWPVLYRGAVEIVRRHSGS